MFMEPRLSRNMATATPPGPDNPEHRHANSWLPQVVNEYAVMTRSNPLLGHQMA